MDKHYSANLFRTNIGRCAGDQEKADLYRGLTHLAEMVAVILEKVENLEKSPGPRPKFP